MQFKEVDHPNPEIQSLRCLTQGLDLLVQGYIILGNDKAAAEKSKERDHYLQKIRRLEVLSG